VSNPEGVTLLFAKKISPSVPKFAAYLYPPLPLILREVFVGSENIISLLITSVLKEIK